VIGSGYVKSPKYNLFDIGGDIIKNDEYSIIRENSELNTVLINSVLLYKDKCTKKMKFYDRDSIYLFIESRGIFELGSEIIYVNSNDIILVPQDTEHRIINIGDVHMKYLLFKERI
jgi:mannose-6-phosphate isomerase-like protein (cupin superfamily)